MMNVHRWTLLELANLSYAVVGNGGFTQVLLELLKINQIEIPEILNPSEPEQASEAPDYLVLGTDTFQLEIMARWQPYLRQGQQFIDVSDLVLCSKFGIPVSGAPSVQEADVIFCGIGTSVSEYRWLQPVRNKLAEYGLSWQALHPLELDADYYLRKAKAVIVWNGSTPIFNSWLTLCHKHQIPLTYAECGFFPQSEHFYFDKQGVNLASQLRSDRLEWLTDKDIEMMDEYRKRLLGGRRIGDHGYIFVPLQISSDSNIQNHSRFTSGMQQYIDYVLSQHSVQHVVFKVHPKDQYADTYQFYGAAVSCEDTIDLVAGASLIRGINSSVLFEAALLGKPVQSDGDSLLARQQADNTRIIAAMIARQYHSSTFCFDTSKLERFSNLGHLI